MYQVLDTVYGMGKGMMMTEKEKYLEWVKREEAKGLKDVHVTGNLNLIGTGVVEEDLYREMNSMNDAIDRGDYTNFTENPLGQQLEKIRRLGRMAGIRFKKQFGEQI